MPIYNRNKLAFSLHSIDPVFSGLGSNESPYFKAQYEACLKLFMCDKCKVFVSVFIAS